MSESTFKIEDVDKLGSTDTLSSEEKEKIFQEMHELFSQADNSAVENTRFDISNASKGILFPVLFNIALIAVVVTALVLTIDFINKRDQASIVSELSVEASASDLVQEIIYQNKAALERQSQELVAIQTELDELLSGRQNLDQVYADRLESFRRQLENALTDEQTKLRKDLEAEQVSEAEIKRRLQEQEVRIRAEYEGQISEYKVQLDKEKAQRQLDLQQQIDNLEREQNIKQVDVQALEQEIQQREQELESEIEAQRVAFESQQSEAESRLFAIQQADEDRQKTFKEFDLFHKNVTGLITRGEYSEANIAIQNARTIISNSRYANELEAQAYVDAFDTYGQVIDGILSTQTQSTDDTKVLAQDAGVISDLEAEVSKYEEQVSDLETQIATLQSDNTQANKQASTLQTQETSLKRTNSQLEARLQGLQKEYDEYKEQADSNRLVGNAGMTMRETQRILDNINTIVNYFVTVKSSGRDDPNMKEEITKFINEYEIYGDIISTLSLVLDPSGDIVF